MDLFSEKLLAPAKLTLDLRVTGARPDGMHGLSATMVTVSLFDALEISKGPASVEVVGATDDVVADESNTVMKAMRLAGVEHSVKLTKNIPSQAGLGGGSTDAAAILRHAGITDTELAAQIGADVAFCLVGGLAKVSGIGEIIEPLPFKQMDFTLYTPPVQCSTVEVYKRWDALGGPTGEHGNDLEPAAIDVAPELVEYRDAFGDVTGQLPRLAGSGSTWFVEGHFDGPSFIQCETVEA